MAESPFLLVSLKEDQAKELAKVISNDTSRKILDHLSKKESATATDLAKDLDMPLSTVHYNITHLVKAKLVDDSHFTYSEKGKEIYHYRLANKYVIIAPRATENLLEKLKKILPVVFVVGACTYAVSYLTSPFGGARALPMMLEAQEAAIAGGAFDAANDVAASTARIAVKEAIGPAARTSFDIMSVRPHVWFLIGAAVAMLSIIAVNFMMNRSSMKR